MTRTGFNGQVFARLRVTNADAAKPLAPLMKDRRPIRTIGFFRRLRAVPFSVSLNGT
jgi:hypothetical protein